MLKSGSFHSGHPAGISLLPVKNETYCEASFMYDDTFGNCFAPPPMPVIGLDYSPGQSCEDQAFPA
jgi:hypothetical protein